MSEPCCKCCPKSACLWVSVLLFICGLILTVKQLYDWISSLTNDIPIIQIILGIISIIAAIIFMAKIEGCHGEK